MKYSWLILWLVVAPLAADDDGAWNRQLPLSNNRANELFAQKNYEEALKSYLDLYGQNTDNGALAYNIANTYAVMGDHEKAREFFRKAMQGDHTEARNRARFNLGNLEMNENAVQNAIQQYVDYLKANPDDVDAKRNLEIALRQLQEQQQQNQDQNQDQDQQQEQQEQQQEQQSQQDQQDQRQNQQDQQQDQQQNQDQQQQDQQQSQDQQQQNQRERQDQQQEQQSQENQQEQDQQEQQEHQKKEQPKDQIDESMKEQILQALKEQEMKQQKEYQKRKVGRTVRRAKDW